MDCRMLASTNEKKYLWHTGNLHGMYDKDLFLLALHSKSAHVVRCSAGDHFIIVLYCFSKIVSPEVSNLESSSSMIGRNFLGWISVRPPLSIKFSRASCMKIYWSWSYNGKKTWKNVHYLNRFASIGYLFLQLGSTNLLIGMACLQHDIMTAL